MATVSAGLSLVPVSPICWIVSGRVDVDSSLRATWSAGQSQGPKAESKNNPAKLSASHQPTVASRPQSLSISAAGR